MTPEKKQLAELLWLYRAKQGSLYVIESSPDASEEQGLASFPARQERPARCPQSLVRAFPSLLEDDKGEQGK